MEQKLFEAASKLPETGLEFDMIQAPPKATARPWRRVAVLAACFVLLISIGFGTYAYAEEVKEYNEAVEFFQEYGLPTEGLSRKEIKAVCRDIKTESFTYSKTAEVIENSLTPEQKNDYEMLPKDPTSENTEILWDYKMNNPILAPAARRIELTCCGNPYNVHTIDDPELYAKLLAWIDEAQATGKQGKSTLGYYGVLYGLDVYKDGEEEPLHFSLWNKSQYSTPEHKDSEGYAYFYEADMTELYTYLMEHYSSDFWNKDKENEEHTAYETTLISANILSTVGVHFGALNKEKLSVSGVQHLPIYKLDTLEDLEQFERTFAKTCTMDIGYMEVPPFRYIIDKCDQAFFKDYTLMVVFVETGTAAHRFDVDRVIRNGESLCVYIKETTGTAGDDVQASWIVTIAIPDSVAANCTEFDAKLQ